MDAGGAIRVHSLISSLTLGGAEMLLAEFAAAAPAAGIQMTVGYLEDRDGSPAAARLRSRGVEPILAPISKSRPLLRPSDYILVRRHLEAVAPDVIHTHLGYADTLGGVAARSLGIPSVSTIHNVPGLPGIEEKLSARNQAKERVVNFARRRCSRLVIAVSDAARSAYLDMGWGSPDEVVTVHNGIVAQAEPGAGRHLRAELGLQPEDLVLSMIGVLRLPKGYEAATAAVAELRRDFPTLKLLIVGEGYDRAEIERLARPLDDAVLFTGHRDDVMAVLDATDVLLHPSLEDAFPTVLLEALAAATPIVATSVGGIPEIVENGGSGVLIGSPPRIERLVEVLRPLLESAERRAEMGEAARRRFDSEFTAELWASRMRSIYQSLLR